MYVTNYTEFHHKPLIKLTDLLHIPDLILKLYVYMPSYTSYFP